jgi:hypothetical protein
MEERKLDDMKNWIVIIPSYRRAETTAKKTLTTLKAGGVPADRVFVFLSDWEERDAYQREITAMGYPVELYEGALGCMENREAYIKMIDEGIPIVHIDDDVTGIFRYVNPKKYERVKELAPVYECGFDCCQKVGTALWCVYPVSNPFFMGTKIRSGFYYAEGSMYGTINSWDEALLPSVPFKEDWERSILYYIKYGKIIRMDAICYESAFYTEPGGMQADGQRTLEAQAEACRVLLRKYPELVEVNTARKNHPDIKLVDKARRILK